ncbi:calcium-binding protein [Nitrococcus mobilis]|uniref:Bacteriocin n=1 Tax=Nitrococcus mobilis Nb-231 TaxID=314278 RepID=A4BV64_9GAMM|nr:calcium-binding protein [Nitrococcus mobilis]EAR20406.1 bacteriocin [Nitrococcus mobilis Nb-231]
MTKDDAAIMTPADVARTVLAGMDQLTNETFDTSAIKERLDKALADARLAGNRLRQIELLEMRHLTHRAEDPALQDALRQSYGTMKDWIRQSLDAAEEAAAQANGTLSEVEKLNVFAGKLGTLAGPAASAISFGEGLHALSIEDSQAVGAGLVGTVAGSIVTGLAVATATTLSLGVLGTAGLVALSSAGAAIALNTVLPDNWAQAIGDPIVDIYDQARSGLTDFFEVMGGIPGILDSTNDYWRSAANWRPRIDPLAVDLDGDGIETVGTNGLAGAVFDQNADGVATASGWIDTDDGLLVMDRNGNGAIDDGRELFGEATRSGDGTAADGFAALADLDSNTDGRIDAADADFAKLRIWQEANGDGVSQAGELHTLEEMGISALNLAHSQTDQSLTGGNRLIQTGTFVRSDGTKGQLGDVDFAEDHFHRRFEQTAALTEEAQALPDMQGSGMVRDLREAASQSADLAQALMDYTNAGTKAEQEALLDGLLQAWSRSSDMESLQERALDAGFVVSWRFGSTAQDDGDAAAATARYDGGAYGTGAQAVLQAYNDGQSDDYKKWLTRLSTLERFNGRTFIEFQAPEVDSDDWAISVDTAASGGTGATVGISLHKVDVNLSDTQLELLEQSYQALRTSVYQGLLFQTRLKPYVDGISLQSDGDQLVLDFSGIEQVAATRIEQDPYNGFVDLLDLIDARGDSLMQSGWDAWSFLGDELRSALLNADVAGLLAERRIVYAADGTVTVAGTADPEMLIGNEMSNQITGGDGGDVIAGARGADVLRGANGADTLRGGEGADELHGGNDHDTLYGDAGADTLYGGWGNDALHGGTGADALHGGDHNDTLYGDAEADTLFGDRGSDTLYGGAGDDVLDGGSDSNTLDGGAGDDLLRNYEWGASYVSGRWVGSTYAGGRGNDRLQGTRYGDTYRFGLGDGADTIKELDNRSGGSDVLVFGEEIAASDIERVREGTDLVLRHVNGTDSVRVHRWFDAGGHRLERVEFADGTVWNRSQVEAPGLQLTGTPEADAIHGGNISGEVLHGLAGDDVLDGHGGNDTLYGDAGADTLYGGWGHDALHGGTGADALHGGDHNDTLYGDAEADTLFGDRGNDTLYGGAGDDVLDGGSDSNTLDGGAGDDLLRNYEWGASYVSGRWVGSTYAGGRGNDRLQGTRYGDTYRFGLGDGADTIKELDNRSGGSDVLVFGEEIAASDIERVREGTDLVLRHVNGTDSVRVHRWFDAGGHRLERVEFADGTVWNRSQVEAPGLQLTGTPEADTIHGGNISGEVLHGLAGDDVLDGHGGNDTLYGDAGADTLYGGWGHDALHGGTGADALHGGDHNDTLYGDAEADTLFGDRGNDTLYGGAGDDVLDGGSDSNTLDGGAGDDLLRNYEWGASYVSGRWVGSTYAGGRGNDRLQGTRYGDTYRFGLGDGADTIKELDNRSGGSDVLVFGAGIVKEDLWLSRNGDDLVIDRLGSSDGVTIADWYTSTSHQVERIKTDEGTVLLSGQVDQLVSAMAAFDPPASGEMNLTPQEQQQLQEAIAATWQPAA